VAQRLQSSRTQRAIIGVSGGLDSTQGADRDLPGNGSARPAAQETCWAYTLPGFGNVGQNPQEALAADDGRWRDGGRDRHQAGGPADAGRHRPYFAKGKKVYDVTFPRTCKAVAHRLPVRLANQNKRHGGGYGDLSELGLGWCTYASASHVALQSNGSVSKTLIQHLIRFVAASGDVDKNGGDPARHPRHRNLAGADPGRWPAAVQSTEQSVGPYALQDFFNLFYLTRLGFRPSKIAFLPGTPGTIVTRNVAGELPAGTAARLYAGRDRQWLELFLRRFFTNQFKRSALPNGPKISSGGSLSPRGDWRAPSDGSPDVWLAELSTVPDPRNKWFRRRLNVSESCRLIAPRLRGGAPKGGGGGRPQSKCPPISDHDVSKSSVGLSPSGLRATSP